ncbi:DUF6082 family protein [Streptomyces sp. L7]
MLFSNRQFGSLLLAHRIGACDWDELLGHLRVLCRNAVFVEYWDHTVGTSPQPSGAILGGAGGCGGRHHDGGTCRRP